MVELNEIYNFLRLSDDLLTAGQPTAAQYPSIAAAGVRTVINLALPSSDGALPDEAGLARSLGLDYVHIPVVWENPQREDFETFARAMDALNDQRLLVHCAANMRVSAFIALYRVRRLGWPKERALADTQRIWDPYTNPVWGKFMDEVLAG